MYIYICHNILKYDTFNSTIADKGQRCWFDKQVKICSIIRWGFAARLNECWEHNVCPNWIICAEHLCGSHQSRLVSSCVLPSSCSFMAESYHVEWHTHTWSHIVRSKIFSPLWWLMSFYGHLGRGPPVGLREIWILGVVVFWVVQSV